MSSPVLAIDRLSVDYRTENARHLALDDVSLSLRPAEILGVVGESGCGKSTLGMTMLRLLPVNGRVLSGSVSLEGHDLAALSAEEMRSVRGRDIAMIFQDPTTSLNTRLTVGNQLLQVQRAHATRRREPRATLRRNAVERLAEVGLPKPDQTFDRYPHELSGGMRQRVAIAMALLFEPKVIVADEATSALDVTLEAQILELLLRLRDDHGTSMMFISHDLGVVSQLCDRVAVMYAGRVVEEVDGEAVLAKPRHPYTQALDAAVPNRRSRGQRLCAIAGRVPSAAEPIPACGFAPRLHLREAGVRRDGAGAVCGRVGRGALFRLCTRAERQVGHEAVAGRLAAARHAGSASTSWLSGRPASRPGRAAPRA